MSGIPLRIAAALLCSVSAFSTKAETFTLATTRGAKLEVQAEFPAGKGPFPALVLAPGQGYHMALPALEKTARRLVAEGVAVYRFNWAWFTADPKAGTPSGDLAAEVQDLTAVLAAAAADPRVKRDGLSVGGKSLGSVVAWRVFRADPSLKAGLFLTPVCSRPARGHSPPAPVGEQTYPGFEADIRPMLFVSGDRDPLCSLPHLYRFASGFAGSARVAVVGGDHGYEYPLLPVAAGEAARDRSVEGVARLAADFLAEAGR